MEDALHNGVAEFEIVMHVKFADGKSLSYRSPRYSAKVNGIGPKLLIHVIQSRVADWVNKIFEEG